MTYDALLKSNIPLVTQDFIDNAINKFNYIKNHNSMLDEQDCVDLSFIFTTLIHDLFDSTREILKKYSLDIYTVANYYKMGIMSLEVASEENKDYIYNRFYQDIVDDIVEYKAVNVNNIYPEDILIDMIEYFYNDFIFGFGISDNDVKLLKEDLKENKLRRMNKFSYDYSQLMNSNIPDETNSLISYSLDNYNIFFNYQVYNKSLFINENIKIKFTLMYTIISELFSKELLKKYNLNISDILKNFELINKDKFEEICILDSDDEEILYNKKFKDFFNKNIFKSSVFNDLKNNLETFYPECIYLSIGFDNDFANNFYKIIGFKDEDIINLKKDISESLKNKILKNEKYKKSKFFNLNDFTNDKEKDNYNVRNVLNVLNDNNTSKAYNLLMQYGYFLDEKDYITHPAIGREKEIKNVILTLLTPDKSSILVGEAGVGKTAIVEGIAYNIKNGNVPALLKNKKIISISTTSLVSGCQYVGMIEERMKNILNELENNKEVIMFIDEIHTIVGAGKGRDGKNDIANILKPYLDRGDIKIIGSTTKEEYDNIMVDPALRRRFEKTIVNELDDDKLKQILNKEIEKLENIYNVKFDFNDIYKNNIISILLGLTKDKNRVYTDKVNNPDLVLSIIKKAFALCLYNNRDKVILDDIKESIIDCDRIYQNVKEREIPKLKKQENNEIKKYTKVIKLPLNN